jgi:hypothetical protein
MAGKTSFELILTDETSFVGPMGSMIGSESYHDVREVYPNKAPETDKKIREELKREIEKAGGTFTSERAGEGTYQPINTPMKKHFPQDISQLIEIGTYASASSAAFAVFLRNVLGTLKDWRDLKGGRSFKVVINGKEVTVKEGDNINELVDKHKRNDET